MILKSIKIESRNLPSDSITVSTHATRRFMRRSGCKDALQARRSIERLFDRATETQIDKERRIRQIVRHKFAEAKYYKVDGWIIVVIEKTIVTIHKGEAGYWL